MFRGSSYPALGGHAVLSAALLAVSPLGCCFPAAVLMLWLYPHACHGLLFTFLCCFCVRRTVLIPDSLVLIHSVPQVSSGPALAVPLLSVRRKMFLKHPTEQRCSQYGHLWVMHTQNFQLSQTLYPPWTALINVVVLFHKTLQVLNSNFTVGAGRKRNWGLRFLVHVKKLAHLSFGFM